MKTKLIIFLLFPLLFGAMLSVGIGQTPSATTNTPETNPHLSEAQLQAIKSIRIESEKKVAPLALRLASAAKQIYENMLADKEDEAVRQRLSTEMNKAMVGMLAVKGQSIRDMVKILTPEQKKFLRSEMQKQGAPGDLSELIKHVFHIPEK